MTSDEVYNIVFQEIKNDFDITNAHGVDLFKSLIKPVLQKYISSFDNTQTFELWTVLEETEDRNGYKIFFDEDDNSFGLGMKSQNDELLYLGNYGTFLETFKGM